MTKNPWLSGILRVVEQVKQASGQNREVALMMIVVHDVDRLYATLGHSQVFEVMTDFHERLEEISREGDKVVQLSDRKYALLLTGFRNQGHVRLAAQKVQRLIRECSTIGGDYQTLDVRIGIALTSADALDTNEIVRRAEIAVLESARSRQPITFYEPGSADQLTSQWNLEKKLTEALESAALEFNYQPKLDLESAAITGAEALIRWHDPVFGQVQPDMLVETAETSGLIPALTHFSIHRACRQLNDWRRLAPDLTVAVNITPSIIRDLEIVDTLESATRIWNIDAGAIILEVTENALMMDPEAGYHVLNEIRNFGAKVSIDDFGTGYSSLAYLRDIPADELKIDRSFVSRMLLDPGDYKIVQHAISIGKSFDLTVVAEGVTDDATLTELRSMGCNMAQGHHICEPLTNDNFIRWYMEYVA